MLKKRVVIALTFLDGVLFRTKRFVPDYRYTKNFVDLWNADEIILIDISKNNKFSEKFTEVVNFFINNCYLPIAVGGGIFSEKKASKLFKLGVEKIIINSSTFYNPELTYKLTEIYGSSSIIHSVDCKKVDKNDYFVFVDNGKKNTGFTPEQWVKKIQQFNIGEILVNNINNDGSLMGYDMKLIERIIKVTNLPIIVLGGAGNWDHICNALKKKKISAACTQNIYHFTNQSLLSLKKFLFENNIRVRIDD
jgi:cyclase